jgi:adenosylcobinamide-phosphate synthase
MDIFWRAFLAALTERFTGYPESVQNAIGHPVQWMGAAIDWLDANLNTSPHDITEGRLHGVVALLILISGCALPAWLITHVLAGFSGGWIIEAMIATVFLAQKSLYDHVRDVERALSSSLTSGRAAVSKIVGRNTETLDESGVSRAALESLAENAADGVVAPVFWYLLLGLPGLVAYKAVNTADSMIGHKSAEHLHFGFASARLDDVLNFIPARLTALLFSGAASLESQVAAKRSFNAAMSDAIKHRSPNAGWPEASMAGALGLRLGGPRDYDGETVDLPWLGSGREHLTRQDITRGLRLYDRSLWLMQALLLAAAILL